MCAACDAVRARQRAASGLATTLNTLALGAALKAGFAVDPAMPPELASLAAKLDEPPGSGGNRP